MNSPPVSYALEIADVYALQKLNLLRKNPNLWLVTHVLPIFAGTLFLLFVAVQILSRQWLPHRTLMDWFGIACVGIGLIWSLCWQAISRFFLKRRHLKNPLFGAQAIVQLEERGVQARGQSGESLVFWSHILSVADEPHHIFLFLSKDSAFIIPKRAFETPQMAQNFADFAQSQWQNAHPAAASAPPISAAK